MRTFRNYIKDSTLHEIRNSLANLRQQTIHLSVFFWYSLVLIPKWRHLLGAGWISCEESGTPSTIYLYMMQQSVTVKTFGLLPDWAWIWLDFPDFKHGCLLIWHSVGTSHRSASPRPRTLEEDRKIFIFFFNLMFMIWDSRHKDLQLFW